MTCPACAKAETGFTAMYHATCKGCDARRVANSPEFDLCRRQGWLTPAYQKLLAQFGVTHEQVRAAARKGV